MQKLKEKIWEKSSHNNSIYDRWKNIDQRCKLIETLEIAQNCNKKMGHPVFPGLILSVFS